MSVRRDCRHLIQEIVRRGEAGVSGKLGPSRRRHECDMGHPFGTTDPMTGKVVRSMDDHCRYCPDFDPK